MWERTKEVFIESLWRTLGAVAARIPVLLAMLLMLFGAILLGSVVRALVQYLCERWALDGKAREWGFAASPGNEGGVCPSRLVARLTGWTVIALGLFGALTTFGSVSSTGAAMRLLDYFPHAFVALMILAVGAAGSREVERRTVLATVNLGLPLARFIGLGARWLVALLSCTIALEQLGVGGDVVPLIFEILLGGITLTLVLAFGLGARGLVARSLESKRFTLPEGGRARPTRDDEIQQA